MAISTYRPVAGRVRGVGVLTRAETVALFARWQQEHDARARDELVERYLPLARKLARRYGGAREPFEDLLQVASLGLVKAVDRFDTTRGTAFSSFAVPTIMGEIKRYFRDQGWAVHVPRGAQERAVKVDEAKQRLGARSRRAPTVPELAEYLELSLEDVLDALECSRAHHATSLDAPTDDGESDGGSIVDTIGAEDPRLCTADTRISLGSAASLLSDRERQVLALRYVHDLTQTEIAQQVGVSQMQISRILRRSIARLRELTGSRAAEPR
ncbi:MAG: SigB/SigF/SigG family RNA polymerase sigma factor [Solirubrobacteraceae bacterium]